MNKEKVANTVQISLSDSPPPLDSPLKDGNFVFVRILQAKGNGQYLVSFAGNTFTVKSKENWTEGSSFKAQIHIKGNTLFLSNQETIQTKNTTSNNLLFSQKINENNLSQQLTDYLQNIGIKPDSISLQLLQYFFQHEIKINSKQINKAHSFASLIPGKEKESTQIALMLLDKGLPCNEQIILQFMNYIYGDYPKNSNQNTNSKDTFNSENIEQNLLSIMFPNEDFSHKKEGLLTLLNHSKKSLLNWIIIPFESGTSTGSIRVLIDTQKKDIKLIKMIYRSLSKTYLIKVKQINKQYKMEFAILPKPSPESMKEINYYINNTDGRINNEITLSIVYNEEITNEGLFTENQELSIIQDII